MLLQNKVALITGAGSGIGRACALTFAADGARVAVLDYDRESAEETVALVRQAGGEALAIHANVAKEAEQRQAVSDCVEHFGALHCAVNNAALGGGFAPLTEFEEKRWQLAQDVTLKGVWLGMKYQIPAMLAAGGGATCRRWGGRGWSLRGLRSLPARCHARRQPSCPHSRPRR